MTDLRALLKRLEALEGPDSDVDEMLWGTADDRPIRALTEGDNRLPYKDRDPYDNLGAFEFLPPYTASLDEALLRAQAEFPNDAADFLRASISAEAKRHHRHVAYAPLDVSELARGVLIEMVKALIAKAEIDEGVGEL